VNRSVRGTAPRDAETALETPVYYLEPAMVIKLIPENSVPVTVDNFSAGNTSDGLLVDFTAAGQDVQAGWVEMSFDKFDWQRISRFIFRPPTASPLPGAACRRENIISGPPRGTCWKIPPTAPKYRSPSCGEREKSAAEEEAPPADEEPAE